MNMPSPLARAIHTVGLLPMAKALGLTYQALRRWEKNGRLPRTEWTGETHYASHIERLTGGAVTGAELLDWGRPKAADVASPAEEAA